MHGPSTKTLRDMEMAAELRAQGATWDTVAVQLGRQPNVVMRWAKLYRDDWERLLTDAEERLSRQASNEGRSVLRSMLRSKSSKLRAAAADQLAQHRFKELANERRQNADTGVANTLAQFEEMSDAELQHLVAEFVRETYGLPGPADVGGAARTAEPGDVR